MVVEMNEKVNVDIPFFVYDKYSKQACFILLNKHSKNEVRTMKIAVTTRISS